MLLYKFIFIISLVQLLFVVSKAKCWRLYQKCAPTIEGRNSFSYNNYGSFFLYIRHYIYYNTVYSKMDL